MSNPRPFPSQKASANSVQLSSEAQAPRFTDNSHHDEENGRPKEPGSVPIQKTVWTIQERLAYLEEEYFKMIAAKG